MPTSSSPKVSAVPSQVSSSRIAILVADDTLMGCQLLENALKRSRNQFHIVACRVAKSDIINYMRTHNVDVALINEDLQDGRFTGLEAAREVHVSYPKTRVVILFNSSENDLVIDAFRAGASGVFCRSESFEALCKCIRAVHKGQVWANSAQLQLLLGVLENTAPLLRVVSSRGINLLAKREGQVVDLLAEGLTNREIALKLGLNQHAVSNYLFRIYNKLGVSTRVELMLYALKQREEGQTQRRSSA